MDGSIRVHSRPGSGSTFEFRIPFVPVSAPPPSAEQPSRGSEKALAGLSVLVVEDDVVNQMVIEENLVDDGARVVIAGNGVEAVDRVRHDGPAAYDVVLMDIQMPVMDGYEATRRILAFAPNLPVIGQTAHASGEERDKCFSAGMVAHIAKPIDSQALSELIRRHAPAKDLPG